MIDVEDFEDIESADSDLFDCEYTSIDAVINEVTVFTGWTERQTENGLRTLIAYGEGNGRSAFYTDIKKLKEVVSAPGRKFPFRAIIKIVNYGNMSGFKFFAPKAGVSQEDKDNFEYYKRNKYRRSR